MLTQNLNLLFPQSEAFNNSFSVSQAVKVIFGDNNK